MKLFARSPTQPNRSAPPSTRPIVDSTPSPYLSSSQFASHTPTSDIGAEPSSIQPASCARTLPILRCWNAPTVLKIAPWAMSEPTATAGLTPKRMTRMGVISEPPPMPVMPTSVPMNSPASVNCHHMR